MPASNSSPVVVGIDVGGKNKGFHAVALASGSYHSRERFKKVADLRGWVRALKAVVVAIDAPCRWSEDGRSRPAERELMQEGIWCFSTPSRATAMERRRQHKLGTASDHFGWMLEGEALFRALEADFPLCRELPTTGQKCCFETYPHAITWHLRGGNADASQKRSERRALLAKAGIDLGERSNIDFVDAAICALTAHYAATGVECRSFPESGGSTSGLIIVPKNKMP